MHLVCLDLEGVLIPEIWKGLAQLTGIQALERTTRDEPDYDVLMRYRLDILDTHGIGMREIRQVVGGMKPLEGAVEFLNWLREHTQVIILSDTFYEFAQPLLHQLGQPTILCHSLEIDAADRITDYVLRQQDQKRHAVLALRSLNYHVIAAGDSYNDLSMLQNAHHGIFFCPPASIVAEHPDFPVTQSYRELAEALNLHLGAPAFHA
jgi:phosphoserine/homoserine phosphotransferase